MTITAETAAEAAAGVVFYGWDVYRRSQQVPMPEQGTGDLMKTRSRLWHAAEPYASGREDIRKANLTVIRLAAADLIDAVREHCGDAAAAFTSGQHGSVAA